MKVILRKDIINLGNAGEVIEVKDGYARNFLLPKKLVEIATPNAIKNWGLGAERRKERASKEVEGAQKVAGKLEATVLTYSRKVTAEVEEEQHMFGSVTKIDVFKSLKELGYELSKDAIKLDAPIKTFGETSVKVYFKPTVFSNIVVKIDAIEDEETKAKRAELKKAKAKAEKEAKAEAKKAEKEAKEAKEAPAEQEKAEEVAEEVEAEENEK
ncbi:MAG: 50S ribosomal protein L9 [Elusimicrobiaceae bacterium]|jgi:large subunit ribosomal protein L9|nr:50S ribosomal protein L9 [Elusimicrobiaceae bacterium]MBT3955338.1 50S ribosomal protein L9 [Elusimicrobiaceae bacterium]MBT4008474.1 50S ribosomal protein L9 [Elusimicrobiaceae bacterium]MBT4403362.1 50S ribosomal protein L9 [Elusimicrobiaceae bacterium]MBT4440203.1 50S ribosomal protein L9 [Elusimicrobiaceae bacterium]